MAVVIETTLGDITVDLYLDQRPVTCLNFLKLCKMKYYNFNLFHTIRNGFIAQTGDPSGEGSGGQSIFGILEGPHKRFFSGEKMPKIRHTDAGLLSMVCTDDMMVGSQFFFTLAPDLNSLDGTHCVIGEVTDGHDVLAKLNEVICDESHRPYRDVRVTHTVVLEDPFNDPSDLRAPSRSPSPSAERLKGGRIAPDEEIDEAQGKSAEEIQEMIEEKEAKARATILEIVGDLPDAEIAPPENVLFVCKLNPVTTDEDLEIIFCRFGKIVSCEVIRDKKTGNSLQYAFIEFDNKKSCEDAYFKMDNVLIDDRRIHVDFSQSVSKMRWLGKGRGVQYFDNDSKKMPQRDDIRGRYREQQPEHINNRRHHENDRNGEERNRKDREYDRDHKERQLKKRERSQNRDHKERSRSRSKHNYDRRHESRKDRNKSSKDNNKHRDHTENRESSYRHDKNRNSHQSYHRSRSSPIRNDRSESRESSSRTIRDISETKNGSRTYNKKKENDRHDKSKYNKLERESKQEKQNSNKHFESKTPSPITKDLKQSSKIDKNPDKKHRDIKLKKKERKSRKHKHSTSSVSSSESSTSDSSSSGSDRKKRKVGKKKRKRSTSSSSSDTSSSSTSSSSDSSSDSSTSSDSSHEKRKRKNKKNVKKSKKKL